MLARANALYRAPLNASTMNLGTTYSIVLMLVVLTSPHPLQFRFLN
jgi:hypothetical protein